MVQCDCEHLQTFFLFFGKNSFKKMDYPRPCGCKGRRTCLACEKEYNFDEKSFITKYKNLKYYVFCYKCIKIYAGDNVTATIGSHPEHGAQIGIEFPGVFVSPDFISANEENALMTGIDSLPWDISQSGRRKQNYGPKTNFKKMKLAHGTFRGFPEYSEFVQERFKDVPLLADFQTIEQCSLEYNPDKGASIDPHIDDCWIWGERVVTVNCLSDSVLTLVRYTGDPKRYNLPLVESYASQLRSPLASEEQLNGFNDVLIKVPMPNRSLIVLYGSPRYQFEHSVLRTDITSRRVCIAYREFTPMYLKNGESFEKSEPIFQTAKSFWLDEISAQ
ncbi:alpha-ketoglutarate-dependent dioxygenase alkB homolog 4 [Sitodiplosis mosellana]|uniref:alpha-ketoglutarate-dependent dioxygenase alkB homolog 4 n=1 Tax=Sitodiplosis mosellana TaxID=263140 RepID=UPI0024439D25|nr:alpha-ketoglutarate-dependent dioxygenase alkB homolog 4 [Sitodiplosis mosellana]